MRTLPAALLVAVAVGCAGRGNKRAETPVPARTPARDSLLAADVSRTDSVRRLGAVNGVVAWLDDDVVYLRAGVPAVYGRDYVSAMLSATSASAGTPMQWQPLGGGIATDARFGYTFGIAQVEPTGAPSDGSAQSKVTSRLERYIAVWHRA